MPKKSPQPLKSNKILKQALKSFFNSEPFIYFDAENESLTSEWIQACLNKNTVNVVLVGSPLSRFAQINLWPERLILWVLDQSQKNVLINFAKIPAQKINVIPRYELFPILKRQRAFPKINDKFTLVYGGRFATAKGVFHCINLAKTLQVDYGLKVELHLCGHFDQMTPHNHLYSLSESDFKKVLLSKIKTNDWTTPPALHLHENEDSWLKLKYQNPVFISLSQHTHEDFGVSLAQAQENGWPCILSPWGAHHSAIQRNVFFIKNNFSVFSEQKKVESDAQLFAEDFVHFLKNKAKTNKTKLPKSRKTVPISRPEIQVCQNNLQKLWPKLHKHLQKNRSQLGYLKSQEGKKFYRIFNRLMRGTADPF